MANMLVWKGRANLPVGSFPGWLKRRLLLNCISLWTKNENCFWGMRGGREKWDCCEATNWFPSTDEYKMWFFFCFQGKVQSCSLPRHLQHKGLQSGCGHVLLCIRIQSANQEAGDYTGRDSGGAEPSGEFYCVQPRIINKIYLLIIIQL